MKFLRLMFNRDKATRPDYSVPEGDLVYAVGDIHGRYDLLQQLMNMIKKDRDERSNVERCQIVFLGDYVDRGFQSKEVIDYLLSFNEGWAKTICLKGNHEAMMEEFIRVPEQNEGWLHFGGLATLASYGVRVKENEIGDQDIVGAARDLEGALPDSHIRFLAGLPLTYEVGDYFFVHAGLRPDVALHEQSAEDMMFIRHDFLNSSYDFGRCVVHGHTGVQAPVVKSNRIAVDTTAYATGRLTAAAFQSTDIEFIIT